MNWKNNIQQIIRYRKDGLSYGLIAQLFGVHKNTIRRVIVKYKPDLLESMRVGSKNLKQLSPREKAQRRKKTLRKYRQSENYKAYRQAYLKNYRRRVDTP